MSIKKYILSVIYKIKTKPKIDLDFWEDVRLIDLESDIYV